MKTEKLIHENFNRKNMGSCKIIFRRDVTTVTFIFVHENELENIKKRCESNITFSIKVAATNMKYFTRNKFSRSLIHKKKLSLI